MNDLPEDPNDWPNDPFELLSLQRSDDARTAKRAYYKLIRKYKPDRCPAEFQKIRAAYESVESWLSWQEQMPDDADAFANALDQADQTVSSSSSFETDQDDDQQAEKTDGPNTVSSTPLTTDPVELFFETLSTKGLKEAVPHLQNVDPSKGSGQVAKSSLIKYFLARFLPASMGSSHGMPASDEVDLGYSKGDLKRIEWLLKALNSPDTCSTAMSQLRLEFDRNYRLANCESVTRFLSKVTDFDSLVQFYHLRWEAIGHYQPWTVIQDVKSNQHRSLEFDRGRGGWLSLLTESMNYTIWHRDQSCVDHTETSWQEIAESGQTWTADSVELLMLAAEQWKGINGAPQNWMAVIPWARNSLPETSRTMWGPVAQEISVAPVESLQTLELLFSQYSLTMCVFEEGLQSLAQVESDSSGEDELPWEETRELVACYFMELRTTDYASNRLSMMEFCILNNLSLQTFAAAANSFVDSQGAESWYDLVHRDGPLKCVVSACHIVNC